MSLAHWWHLQLELEPEPELELELGLTMMQGWTLHVPHLCSLVSLRGLLGPGRAYFLSTTAPPSTLCIRRLFHNLDPVCSLFSHLSSEPVELLVK